MEKRLHVVVLPWLAMGHILPFFELSKRLVRKGHRVSFLCTPRNLRRLPPTPQHLSSLLHMVEFPLPRVEQLPSDAEATIDLPTEDLRPHLRKAFDALEGSLCRFLEDGQSPPVDWILYDYAPYWVPRVAVRFGVPCVFLGLFNAGTLAFYGPPDALTGGAGARTSPEQLTVPPEWVPFPSAIAFRGFEAREIFKPAMERDVSGVSEAERFAITIRECQFAAVRSCPEFEQNWQDLLRKIYGKPVIPIGLLPPAAAEKDDDHGSRWADVFEWLDAQEPGSVVYAAFGSEVKLSYGQLLEIAGGLERSGLPFLWALRRPASDGDGEGKELDKLLRNGLGRGVVCENWLPQTVILAHRAVGGFLTHCGWNSLVEGLSLGRPIVLLPLVYDQGLNARNLTERGIGVEVARDEDDGSFSADGIAEALRLVIASPEGHRFREKARDSMAIFGAEPLHDRYLSRFLDYLVENRPAGRTQ